MKYFHNLYALLPNYTEKNLPVVGDASSVSSNEFDISGRAHRQEKVGLLK